MSIELKGDRQKERVPKRSPSIYIPNTDYSWVHFQKSALHTIYIHSKAKRCLAQLIRTQFQ